MTAVTNTTSLLDQLTSIYTMLGLKKTNTYPSPLLAKKKEQILAPGSRTKPVVNLTIVNCIVWKARCCCTIKIPEHVIIEKIYAK